MSIEDVLAKVDERVNGLNPYQRALNDPDPMRSRAAMEIMLESGDPTLVRMAKEVGLLSTDPGVRALAVAHVFAQKPVLTLRFDGSGNESSWFDSAVTSCYKGTQTDKREGIMRIAIGEFDTNQKCFTWLTAPAYCAITLTADNLLLSSNPMNGSFEVSGDGSLKGTISINNVAESISASIQMIE